MKCERVEGRLNQIFFLRGGVENAVCPSFQFTGTDLHRTKTGNLTFVQCKFRLQKLGILVSLVPKLNTSKHGVSTTSCYSSGKLGGVSPKHSCMQVCGKGLQWRRTGSLAFVGRECTNHALASQRFVWLRGCEEHHNGKGGGSMVEPGSRRIPPASTDQTLFFFFPSQIN